MAPKRIPIDRFNRAYALSSAIGDADPADVAALVEWARRNPEAWAGLREATAAVVPVEATEDMRGSWRYSAVAEQGQHQADADWSAMLSAGRLDAKQKGQP